MQLNSERKEGGYSDSERRVSLTRTMPAIKISHVVSFSSEDAVHRAENLLTPK